MSSIRNILILEDREDDAYLLQRCLRNVGYQPETIAIARNRIEAFTHLDRAAKKEVPVPSLVFLDLSQPVDSDFDWLHWFKQNPVFMGVPAVVLLRSSNKEYVRRAFDEGANSCFEKPADFDDYNEMVASIMKFWEANQLPEF